MTPKLIFNNTILISFTLTCLMFMNCKTETTEISKMKNVNESSLKLSLAQWSLHRYVENEQKSPFDFASQAKKLGFEGLEYVSQLYKHEIEKLGFDAVIDSLFLISKDIGMQNVLIMVDEEGDLANPDEAKRNQAVENHKRWVDAAQKLGCHAIRVNTFGTNDPKIWQTSVVDGLRKLSEYAMTKNINILCENHGWLSSNPEQLMLAINTVNLPNCGTLPDFGNWCLERINKDDIWGDFAKEYPDKYQGVKLMMPAAKAISAKSYDFDEVGNETSINYTKMMRIVREAGYQGYIGVEYEGDTMDEMTGITATRDLLIKVYNLTN